MLFTAWGRWASYYLALLYSGEKKENECPRTLGTTRKSIVCDPIITIPGALRSPPTPLCSCTLRGAFSLAWHGRRVGTSLAWVPEPRSARRGCLWGMGRYKMGWLLLAVLAAHMHALTLGQPTSYRLDPLRPSERTEVHCCPGSTPASC